VVEYGLAGVVEVFETLFAAVADKLNAAGFDARSVCFVRNLPLHGTFVTLCLASVGLEKARIAGLARNNVSRAARFTVC
jgi:hypothetical protein